MYVHAFLVRGVLVDCAFPAVARDVARLLAGGGVRGAMITHDHEDHAGNAELLAQHGIPMAIPAATLPALLSPSPIAFYRRFTWTSMPPLRSRMVPFEDESLELVHAPGHSPDHHVVWDNDTDTLFAGDLFLGVKVRVAHDYAEPRREVATLRALAERQPSRMFCGHRGLVPNPVSALRAKANWIESTIADVEQLHAAGLHATEIRRRVLGTRGSVHWFSNGEYSPDNYVQAILRGR